MNTHSRRATPRGFTLIEVLIVMVILGILTVPFMSMVSMSYSHFHAVASQVDLKAEAEGAAARIFRRVAASGSFRIDRDNHGLAAGTAHFRWDAGRLVMHEGGRSECLSSHEITDFVAVRRGPQSLSLSIAVSKPSREPGRTVTWYSAYDHEAQGAALASGRSL